MDDVRLGDPRYLAGHTPAGERRWPGGRHLSAAQPRGRGIRWQPDGLLQLPEPLDRRAVGAVRVCGAAYLVSRVAGAFGRLVAVGAAPRPAPRRGGRIAG